MKAVVTRVSEASVNIEGELKAKIKKGYLILLGIAKEDNLSDVNKLADKIVNLRIFDDEAGKMNLSLSAVNGEVLVVSQFTLLADLKSRRPGFSKAACPHIAKSLYEEFIKAIEEKGICVASGEFGSDMQVSSVNDGPVTIVFDTHA